MTTQLKPAFPKPEDSFREVINNTDQETQEFINSLAGLSDEEAEKRIDEYIGSQIEPEVRRQAQLRQAS